MQSFDSLEQLLNIDIAVAGITLAIALSKHNPSLKITIFESRAAFSEIGAGVGKCLTSLAK